MINDIIADGEQRMQKSLEALKSELTKLRTGRAHPSLLEHITVPYYGAPVPLSQVATVSIGDSRTLLVVPWEKDMVGPVEKAIISAELGLNPATAGTNIRIPLPPLTEERRRDMTKVVRSEAEAGRVSIRNIRRDMNSQFKDLLKEKMITEDEARQAEDRAQKATDKFIADAESMAADKEKDLMAI